MAPSLDDLRTHLLDIFSPVCEPLYELWETATHRTLEHFRTFGIPQQGWQQSHLTRAHVHAEVSRASLPGLQLLEPCLNGRFLLQAGDGSTLRMLHSSGGVVPAPGKNLARIRYYQQQQLAIPLGLASALLGLWSADPDGNITLRVVRPIGKWQHNAPARVDLDFVLPRTTDGMQGLEFRPDDTGMTLHIPPREETPEFAGSDGKHLLK